MQNVDWEVIYSVVVYVTKNYPLTIILYTVLCFVLGIVISMLLTLTQFKPIIKGILIIWGLLMLIPWVEYVVYQLIMKRKRTKNVTA